MYKPGFVHGRESLDTTFLPCMHWKADKNEVPREKTIFAVQGPLCSVRGWDRIGHAVSPYNSIVQAFLALLLLEEEVWVTQTVLWLKSCAASPELFAQHRSLCRGVTEPEYISLAEPWSPPAYYMIQELLLSSAPTMYFVIVHLVKILIESFISQ